MLGGPQSLLEEPDIEPGRDEMDEEEEVRPDGVEEAVHEENEEEEEENESQEEDETEQENKVAPSGVSDLRGVTLADDNQAHTAPLRFEIEPWHLVVPGG